MPWLAFFSLGLRGQEYVPFPTDSAHWHIYYVNGCYPDTLLLRYALHGDTIMLDGVEYNKLYIETGDTLNPEKHVVGGLREENQKIYYYDVRIPSVFDSLHGFYGATGPAEILLYDFSVEIGDTIMHGGFFLTLILDIDSVLIKEKYRKRYKVWGCSYHSPDYIIEGIGSVGCGLFGHITVYPECGPHYWEHVCFKERGVVKHLNPDYNSCYPEYLFSGMHKISAHSGLSMFPNPVSEALHINLKCQHQPHVISLYNAHGSLVYQQEAPGGTDMYTLDTTPFPSGLYVVEVLCGGSRYMGHVVIKVTK